MSLSLSLSPTIYLPTVVIVNFVEDMLFLMEGDVEGACIELLNDSSVLETDVPVWITVENGTALGI